jgi:hypothetical protein
MAPISDRLFEITSPAALRLLRLFIDGVEVTQAIQHYGASSHLTDPADRGPDNSLRLVTDKPAWVRVYVAGRNLRNVTGTVEVFRRQGGFLWQSLGVVTAQPPGSVTAAFNADYATQRRTLSSSLNFIIPRQMMCGVLRLTVNIASGGFTDSLTLSLNLTLQQTLRLAGVMISYNGPQSSAPNAPTITIAAPTVADLQAMSGPTLTMFPVRATANFRTASTIMWNRHLQDPLGTTGCTTNWDALHAAVVNARTADGNQAGWVYYGVLPTGVPMGPVIGCGGGGVSVGSVGDGPTMAHEIAHACGLEHAPCGGAPRPDPNFPTYEPYAAASIGEYGLDINNGNIADPATTRDFMSYCAPRWISPYHHRLLIDNARLNPTTVCVDSPWWKDLVWIERLRFPRIPLPDPPPFEMDLAVFPPALPPADVISVIVRVTRGAVSEVLHVTRSHVRPQIEGSVETPLTVRLLDGQGRVLSEGALLRVPSEACSCGRRHAGSCSTEPDSYLAQAFVPNVARGASLEINDAKTTQWKRKAPKTPVKVSSLTASVEGDHSIRAKWSTRGKAVEFWLRYSTGDGPWRSIVTGITEGSAHVPAGTLPSGTVRLQVVAHDGFDSDESKSIELTVPERAPDVAIVHPVDGFTYVEQQSLRLWGAATASNGAPAADEHCSWTLDGKEVGRGLDLWIAAPAAGRHELVLTARAGDAASLKTITFVTTGAIETKPGAPRGRSAPRAQRASGRKAAPTKRRAKRS